jgi:hypothetical protein
MGVHGVDEKRLGGVVVRSEDLGGPLELAHVRLGAKLRNFGVHTCGDQSRPEISWGQHV